MEISKVTRWNIATLADLESAVASMKSNARLMGAKSMDSVFLTAGFTMSVYREKLTDDSPVVTVDIVEMCATRGLTLETRESTS